MEHLCDQAYYQETRPFSHAQSKQLWWLLWWDRGWCG